MSIFQSTGVGPCGVVVDELFADHMVLQRDMPVRVWGKAMPLAVVRVTIEPYSGETVAASDGLWSIELPGRKATLIGAAASTILVQAREAEEEAWHLVDEYNDVLFGDVWVASGQSNMEWMLWNADDADVVLKKLEDNPVIGDRIRVCTTTQVSMREPITFTRMCEPKSAWQRLRGEAAAAFSAVATHFALALREHIDIPLGIIGTYRGGTRAESWTPANVLYQLDFHTKEHLPKPEDLATSPIHKQRILRALADPEAEHVLYKQQMQKLWNEPPMQYATGSTDGDGWESVRVPGMWGESLKDVDGIRWYRKTVDIPKPWRGKALTMRLGLLDDFDQTYVNGVLIGEVTPEVAHGYLVRRVYTLPADLTNASSIEIAIRLVDHWMDGGFNSPADELTISLHGEDDTEAVVPLAGEWRALFEYKMTDDAKAALSSAEVDSLMMATGPIFSNLWNAKVYPLTQAGIAGVIWYQGESNAAHSAQYHKLFSAMIEAWRAVWQKNGPKRPTHLNGSLFPFYFVQLAGYAPTEAAMTEQKFAMTREAQRQTLRVPNTGMATAFDLGDKDDIHPKNKHDVGRRLALLALHDQYGVDLTPSGPIYASHHVRCKQIVIDFAHGDGLATNEGSADVSLVELCAPDGNWHKANARIHSNQLVCECPLVPDPVAVRYAWAEYVEHAVLINSAGLPAPPFQVRLD